MGRVFGQNTLDNDGEITYTTPITDDVLGYLFEDDVMFHLNEIKNLQSK
jgi:hypothetical protein